MNALNPRPTSAADPSVYPFPPAVEPHGAPAVDPGSSRPWGRYAIIGMVLLVAGVLAWKVFAPKPAPPAASSGIPEVTVVVPGTSSMAEAVSAPGSIAARRDASVGVQGEGGRVDRVLVEAGQRVAAGQVLAVIDRRVQAQEIAQLEASVRRAEADARLAEANLQRAQSLVEKGFISRADIDQRTATRDSALAAVGVARAQMIGARERTARLDVRAPAAGLVLARNVEAGQVVGPGSGALFRIAEGGVLEMRAQVAEQDMNRLKIGMPAEVTPVGSTTSYRGTVWLLDPVIDPSTRQGIARVQLNYAPGLRVGAFARANIAAGSVARPLLPQSAVLADGEGNYVFVLGKDNRVERRSVTVGVVSDAGVGISRGLTGQEKVVASAGAFLKPGDKIAPVLGKIG